MPARGRNTHHWAQPFCREHSWVSPRLSSQGSPLCSSLPGSPLCSFPSGAATGLLAPAGNRPARGGLGSPVAARGLAGRNSTAAHLQEPGIRIAPGAVGSGLQPRSGRERPSGRRRCPAAGPHSWLPIPDRAPLGLSAWREGAARQLGVTLKGCGQPQGPRPTLCGGGWRAGKNRNLAKRRGWERRQVMARRTFQVPLWEERLETTGQRRWGSHPQEGTIIWSRGLDK